MNILFLSDNFFPEVNATSSRVYERAVYWVKAGHQVTVITCAPNFPLGKIYEGYQNKWRFVENIDGIRVVRVKTFISANEGFFLRTLDYISYMLMAVFMGLFEKRPDIVLATSPQFFAAIGGWLLSVFKWCPFVFEVSDLWPASIVAVGAMRRGFFIRCLEKIELFLYRRAAAIVLLTKAFKANLVSRGVQADKVTVVRNGVDLQRYHPQPKDASLLKKWGLQNKFVVGYIGTHGMAHQLSDVLVVAEKLAHESSIHFLFVGDGADKPNLLAQVKQKQLTNVTLLPAQPKAAVPHYWSLCDVALVHLKNDPLFSTVIPSKMFEAMAMAKPVLLVLPKGEAAEVLLEDRAGEWVPAGSPEKIVQAIQALLAHPDKLETYQQHAKAAAKQHTRQQQADAMLAVLKKVATF